MGYIMHPLDTLSMLNASAVCSSFRVAAKEELRKRVKEQTQKHLRNVDGFYAALGSVDGIVSGSTALAVIATGSDKDDIGGWQADSDLDIYLPNEAARNDILDWLEQNEDYQPVMISKRQTMSYWRRSSVKSVLRLRSNRYRTHIDIICAEHNSATFPITTFWGTHVMNYITSTNIVILYPRTTLSGGGFLNPQTPPKTLRRMQKKYSRRKFTIAKFPHNSETCHDPHRYCPSTFRFTEDKQSLSLAWSNTSPSVCFPRPPSFNTFTFCIPPSFWKWSTCPKICGSSELHFTIGTL